MSPFRFFCSLRYHGIPLPVSHTILGPCSLLRKIQKEPIFSMSPFHTHINVIITRGVRDNTIEILFEVGPNNWFIIFADLPLIIRTPYFDSIFRPLPEADRTWLDIHKMCLSTHSLHILSYHLGISSRNVGTRMKGILCDIDGYANGDDPATVCKDFKYKT
jgi:hypothetical protein